MEVADSLEFQSEWFKHLNLVTSPEFSARLLNVQIGPAFLHGHRPGGLRHRVARLPVGTRTP